MKNRFAVYVPGSQSFVSIYVVQLDEAEVVKYRLLGRKLAASLFWPIILPITPNNRHARKWTSTDDPYILSGTFNKRGSYAHF